MKTLFDKIEINEIEFQTSHNEVSVKCNITQGNFTYSNEIILNFSDLNRLISKIQKILHRCDLINCFKSIKLADGEDLYYFKNDENKELTLPLIEFDDFQPLRQIRA